MGARQRKYGMIVLGREPGRRAVALLAGMGEALSRVAGCSLVIGRVAGVTIRGDLPEDARRMAACTIQSPMPAREREEVVTHECPLPTERRVATLTIGGPSARGMIRRSRSRQVGPVTQVALDRGPPKLTRRGAGMTAFTGRHRVGPEQRKPRPGVFGDQSRRPPTGLLVAPPTIQAE